MGGTYRPKDQRETTGFTGANAIFANEDTFREFQVGNPNVADGHLNNANANHYHGPVALFGSSSDANEPTTLVDPHLDFESDSDSRISISAKSL